MSELTVYGKRVSELFEQQGFDVCEITEDHMDILEAKKDGESLFICYESSNDLGKIRETLEEFIDKEFDGKQIFFSRIRDEDSRKSLENLVDKEEVEISFFSYEEENEPDIPDYVPSSYEIVGDVAIVNLESDQKGREKEIAEHIIRQNPNIETVLEKEENLSGEFRVGGYRKIVGESTETVHREHGARFKLDPTKVFFSERLAHERQRVVEKVKDGEVVHAWFAGVGPYPVLVARHGSPEKVFAIEKNPAACEYMEENIELNSVGEKVESFCGDVEDIVPDIEGADRIIMPLPKGSKNFLELAFDTVKENGIIHYYRFASEDERWDKIVSEIEEVSKRKGRDFEIIEKEVCGHYAPYVHRVCVDFRVY